MTLLRQFEVSTPTHRDVYTAMLLAGYLSLKGVLSIEFEKCMHLDIGESIVVNGIEVRRTSDRMLA